MQSRRPVKDIAYLFKHAEELEKKRMSRRKTPSKQKMMKLAEKLKIRNKKPNLGNCDYSQIDSFHFDPDNA